MLQCARRFLHHLIANCKGPIDYFPIPIMRYVWGVLYIKSNTVKLTTP